MEELEAGGKQVGFDETLREIRERDARDAGRDVAPMRAADDAVLVDSSEMSLDAVIDHIEVEVRRRAAR